MNTETQKNAEIRAQAQNWYVRLADDQAAPEDWIEFTQWLESDPRHVDAYDEIELTLSGLVADAQANTHDETNNVVSLSEVRRSRWNMATTVRALAAVFVAAIVVLGVLQVQQGPTDIQHYATQIGEQKEVVLADGTHLILNTNTQLTITMTKKTRTAKLETGEAYFEIGKDTRRPFRVKTMGVTITDIGTAFSVLSFDDHLSVAVAEGIVDLAVPTQTVRLKQGAKADYERGTKNIYVTKTDIETISSWRDGVLMYENVKLSEIIPELNRYFQTPITIKDDQAGNLTFSGVLNIEDQNKMLSSLEALLPITTKTENGQILLIRQN